MKKSSSQGKGYQKTIEPHNHKIGPVESTTWIPLSQLYNIVERRELKRGKKARTSALSIIMNLTPCPGETFKSRLTSKANALFSQHFTSTPASCTIYLGVVLLPGSTLRRRPQYFPDTLFSSHHNKLSALKVLDRT